MDIVGLPPDGIDGYSSNTPRAADERILDAARQNRIPVLCNSDAPACEYIGRDFNQLNAVPRGDQDRNGSEGAWSHFL